MVWTLLEPLKGSKRKEGEKKSEEVLISFSDNHLSHDAVMKEEKANNIFYTSERHEKQI